MGTVYYEMADFLVSEDKDSKKTKELGYTMKLRFQKGELKRIKQSQVVKKIEVLADDDSCRKCLKLNGKIFSIDKALKKNPLPVERCTHKYGCRCTYLPVVK